jgi:hypothetical protein
MTKYGLLFLALSTFSKLYSQTLTIDEIEILAQKMLISNEYSIEVIKVSKNIKNHKVALLSMPYREFPSIIIFKLDETEHWIRVFEGLSPGIQDKPSDLFDWHTSGLGIDFITDEDTELLFHHDKVTKIIEAMNESKSILIPYQNFFHFHTSDSLSTKEFEPYTIDKTGYFSFANQLFGQRYSDYPKDQCIMFDTPKTIDFSFDYVDGKYFIEAITENGQIWQYSFLEIDDQFKFLLEKQIRIKSGS